MTPSKMNVLSGFIRWMVEEILPVIPLQLVADLLVTPVTDAALIFLSFRWFRFRIGWFRWFLRWFRFRIGWFRRFRFVSFFGLVVTRMQV